MRALLQRVTSAKVMIDQKCSGSIKRGLLILLGVKKGDSQEDVAYLAQKTAKVRCFNDEKGKMNLSAVDIDAQALVVSQFTLYANNSKGARPSFTDAAEPVVADQLYQKFIQDLKNLGLKVESGRFAANMQVELCNDGPVTLMLESKNG